MNTRPQVTIYTDGACSPNPGAGGYGVVLITEGIRRELSGGVRHTTNNRMELLSIIVGLNALDQPECDVTIYSDAQYVVNYFMDGSARRWQKNNWYRVAGRPQEKNRAKNIDLWTQLLEASLKHTVTMKWIRGHNENPENERCDQLAVEARQRPDLPEDEGFLPAAPPAPVQPLRLEQACFGGF